MPTAVFRLEIFLKGAIGMTSKARKGAGLRVLELTEERKTLDAILFDIEMLDDQGDDFDPEQHKALVEHGMVKIDNCVHVVDGLSANAERYRAKAARYAAMARAAENRAEWLKGYVAKSLKNHGLEKFPGNEYVASLRKSKAVELKVSEKADAMASIRYEKYVKVEYTYSKSAITEGLKSGDPLALELGDFKERDYVAFLLKKPLDSKTTTTEAASAS